MVRGCILQGLFTIFYYIYESNQDQLALEMENVKNW